MLNRLVLVVKRLRRLNSSGGVIYEKVEELIPVSINGSVSCSSGIHYDDYFGCDLYEQIVTPCTAVLRVEVSPQGEYDLELSKINGSDFNGAPHYVRTDSNGVYTQSITITDELLESNGGYFWFTYWCDYYGDNNHYPTDQYLFTVYFTKDSWY